MTVIGVHDLFDGLAGTLRRGLSSDGGLSLVLLNGLLLVPLGFAAFFYPVEAALIGAAVVVATTLAALALARAGWLHSTHQPARDARARHR